MTPRTAGAPAAMNEERHIEFPLRLNRYLAICGVAARRKAEEFITSKRVSVDGRIETSVGRVLEEPADVRVDGRVVGPVRNVYIIMNKPAGILSAASDARESTVMDLLPDFYKYLGLYPVGRLDKRSEGLIILTNDGRFARDLIHPSGCVERTYSVELKYPLNARELKEWRDGVIMDGRRLKPISVREEDYPASFRHFRVVLGEGIKREIRLMAKSLGNSVVRLRRVGIGRLFLDKLRNGAFCEYNYKDLCDMIKLGGKV
ncbi:MAG: rRNA pseudouridine synthase [Synergistaceae bacterium]|jgi:23S rRNA pseudouridine2605 synthase|nr:rRNA pseudouridine synthase [Synergistaceae bacterium]